MKKILVLLLIAVFSVSTFSCQAKSPKEKAADAFYSEARDFLEDVKKMAEKSGEDEIAEDIEKELESIEKREISVESLAEEVEVVMFVMAFLDLPDGQAEKLDSTYEKLDNLYDAYVEAPEE